MNDSQYNLMADELLLAIEEAVEEAFEEQDEELDYESVGGKLSLTFVDGSKIIINKQAPLHEIWVATKFNGHHFAFTDDIWLDKRGGGEFWQFISAAIEKQSGIHVDLRGA
ncbi:iron donor protein CyaY [Thalassotalea agarivorans]|uniref:Iron-sulfur cluster assembly protein CyaY n=1 Tax=Thalassotalea agarivorans TaxID=349064 RepID=A0A1I0CJK9_THASX|nr:iron donor protein CyaY [Thalassotalea agarivorans]SET19355.1 CyaY protein [Thalassotalea agarivorans]